DLPLVEQSLTLVSAYGAYLLSEELGGSGVIGVVTVGIILGNYGSRIGMNPRTRLLVSEFWEFLAFFVNSIVFLLIGDQIQFSSLISNFYLIVVAIAAVLITRIIAILVLANFSNVVAQSDINFKEQIILWWGGLRGSVSIAIALSVPTILGDRQEIIDIVFGVVLFTLLVEGLSTKWLLNKLDLIGDQSQKRQYAELLAQRLAFRRVKEYLDKMDKLPDVDEEFYQLERKLITNELATVTDKLAKIEEEKPELKDVSREQLRAKLLDIEADTYAELIRSGSLDSNLSSVIQDILVRSIEDEPYNLRRYDQAEEP
ncbi:MAG: sodium:proton antiporter, partial [Synechococcaceae cyanobacterium RL_1_2]|nr:sodium:proton antiporter [Synechococcaceae cyanobacterium RL_1_2]